MIALLIFGQAPIVVLVWFRLVRLREVLIKCQIVIPANAGIQKNPGAGHRLSPV
jgi:hypothetical protein